MLKDYIFHYKEQDAKDLDYHRDLLAHDGCACFADTDKASGTVEAYFDDGSELDVYVYELQEV